MISRRWASLMETASSQTRTSEIPARSDLVMASEWCGIIELIQSSSWTVV